MRILMFAGWCLVPLIFMGYHMGPGQAGMALDRSDRALKDAQQLAATEDYEMAIERLNAALAEVPADKPDQITKIRLERARLQMQNHQLPEAFNELQELSDQLEKEPPKNPVLLTEVQSAFANAQYYVTWLMRLEGRPREEWEPQIESSRQIFRQLAEDAKKAGNTQLAAAREEDLESSIRLARMDVGDLQGLPMPKQCQQCKSGKCNCKGKKPSQKKGENKTEDARGASSGPPPDGAGN